MCEKKNIHDIQGSELDMNFETFQKKHICIPRTQMGPLVLLGKGLVLRGSPSKIEVIGVLGIYIYTYIN